jgi:hypothetical protein
MNYNVYLVTDPRGCWPLITNCTLPWPAMRSGLVLVYPRGTFGTLPEALGAAAEIRAVAAEQEGTPLELAERMEPRIGGARPRIPSSPRILFAVSSDRTSPGGARR